MKLKLTNNAETTLAGAISDTDTTVLLTPGTGALFPQIGDGEFFPMTLVKSAGGVPGREIVYATARSGDTCTVQRGQEGTAALPFSAGDYAGCHMTAGCFDQKADLSGANFVGHVDMAGCRLTQAVMTDCAVAFNDNLAATTMNIGAGPTQRWAPAPSAQTLSIVGWPAGGHGELLIYGQNLGAAAITLDGNPVNFVNSDGTFTKSNNLNTNHGATLQTNGMDFILFWSPDGGTTRFCKVVR